MLKRSIYPIAKKKMKRSIIVGAGVNTFLGTSSNSDGLHFIWIFVCEKHKFNFNLFSWLASCLIALGPKIVKKSLKMLS